MPKPPSSKFKPNPKLRAAVENFNIGPGVPAKGRLDHLLIHLPDIIPHINTDSEAMWAHDELVRRYLSGLRTSKGTASGNLCISVNAAVKAFNAAGYPISHATFHKHGIELGRVDNSCFGAQRYAITFRSLLRSVTMIKERHRLVHDPNTKGFSPKALAFRLGITPDVLLKEAQVRDDGIFPLSVVQPPFHGQRIVERNHAARLLYSIPAIRMASGPLLPGYSQEAYNILHSPGYHRDTVEDWVRDLVAEGALEGERIGDILFVRRPGITVTMDQHRQAQEHARIARIITDHIEGFNREILPSGKGRMTRREYIRRRLER